MYTYIYTYKYTQHNYVIFKISILIYLVKLNLALLVRFGVFILHTRNVI